MITLRYTGPQLEPTQQAAVDAWLRGAENVLNAEMEQRFANVAIYGNSHPEMMLPQQTLAERWADLVAAGKAPPKHPDVSEARARRRQPLDSNWGGDWVDDGV